MSKKFVVGKTAYTIYGDIVTIKSVTATKVTVTNWISDSEATYNQDEISMSRAKAWGMGRAI